MSISLNIRHLRGRNNLTQKALADLLGFGKTTISNYEKGVSEPDLDICIKISKIFGVSLDNLVSNSIDYDTIPDVTFTNIGQLHGVSNILVPISANAGASVGYSQEWVNQDPVQLNLPGLPTGSYRTFPINGNSMEPYVLHGDHLVSSRIDDIRDCRLGQPYIVVTSSGIWCKQILLSFSGLELHSFNLDVLPFVVAHDEVLEVWNPFIRITTHLVTPDQMSSRLLHLEQRVAMLSLPKL